MLLPLNSQELQIITLFVLRPYSRARLMYSDGISLLKYTLSVALARANFTLIYKAETCLFCLCMHI